jgi:hypothetical protein
MQLLNRSAPCQVGSAPPAIMCLTWVQGRSVNQLSLLAYQEAAACARACPHAPPPCAAMRLARHAHPHPTPHTPQACRPAAADKLSVVGLGLSRTSVMLRARR